MDEQSAVQGEPMLYATAFLFYFCNYFVIVFFNSALVACVMKILTGESATVGYGLGMAAKRLPQIFGWALLSAVIGVLLKAIENAHKRAGRLIAALLGSAWTALTFFVVPVIVIDGLGPAGAFKQSASILKSNWGTALVGNFSLGGISFLLMLPVILLGAALIWLAVATGSQALVIATVAVCVALLLVVSLASSAANAIFKSCLYVYATGQAVPADVDTSGFDAAFRSGG